MDALQKEAFLEAYDLYAEAIYRHCYFRVFSRQRAEELTQDTFMRAWQYLLTHESRGVENWKAFLYRIATNLVIDHARRKKEESLDSLLETERIREPHYDGHRDIERDALLGEVMKTLNQMDKSEAKLFVMRYIDDMQPQEIADILETSANTISVKLNHIAGKIRKRLSHDDQ